VTDALRVLTWNLNGLDERALDERTELACFAMLLRPVQPDVVLLQEVVGRSWHAHLKHHFAAAGYSPWPVDPPAHAPGSYFALVLHKKTLQRTQAGVDRFAGSTMGRALVWARLDWAGRDLLVCTAHLESLRDGKAERVRQAGEVVAKMRSHGGPALFGGDTNLRAEEVPTIAGISAVSDAWDALGQPAATRDTWFAAKGPARARYDRVWLAGLSPVSLALLGEPDRPSDHKGVEVVVGLTA
jgi:endonuclease/exonuclease/phosphatase family metal-dependent hydrolase